MSPPPTAMRSKSRVMATLAMSTASVSRAWSRRSLTGLSESASSNASATVTFPERAKVVARIDRETCRRENLYLDANRIAERISSDHLGPNMVPTGAAVQHGCLPITAGSIEESIRLNGTAVAVNLAAFRWGRAAVIDPIAVRRVLASPDRGPLPTGQAARLLLGDHDIPDVLRPVLEPRLDDLVASQGTGETRGC